MLLQLLQTNEPMICIRNTVMHHHRVLVLCWSHSYMSAVDSRSASSLIPWVLPLRPALALQSSRLDRGIDWLLHFFQEEVSSPRCAAGQRRNFTFGHFAWTLLGCDKRSHSFSFEKQHCVSTVAPFCLGRSHRDILQPVAARWLSAVLLPGDELPHLMCTSPDRRSSVSIVAQVKCEELFVSLAAFIWPLALCRT